MTRLDAMKLILDGLPNDPVIANCGATSRELASIRHSDQHLYILDSMGIASSVGLGLALGLEESAVERVIVLEGDGALLMNLNSMASIGFHRPRKLLLVVLDNGAYASTGGQPTYASQLDLAEMARSVGLTTLVVENEAELTAILTGIKRLDEPLFLHVKIAPGNSPDIPLLLEDPAVIGDRFGRWIKQNQR